jgi:hypothetical protein
MNDEYNKADETTIKVMSHTETDNTVCSSGEKEETAVYVIM